MATVIMSWKYWRSKLCDLSSGYCGADFGSATVDLFKQEMGASSSSPRGRRWSAVHRAISF